MLLFWEAFVVDCLGCEQWFSVSITNNYTCLMFIVNLKNVFVFLIDWKSCLIWFETQCFLWVFLRFPYIPTAVVRWNIVAVVAAEQETAEQHDKAEPQPAAMPDYAAGLLAPTFDVSVSSAIIIIFMWLLMFALLAWQHEGLPQSW